MPLTNEAQCSQVQSLPDTDIQSTIDPYGVYSNRRLNSVLKEIRLLHVQNGPKDTDLVCFFEYVLLDHKPNYVALSYCWGTSPERKTILVEGKPFRVTNNAEEALKGLRKEEGENHLVIWIDAVCINQMDPTERSEQVAMMRDVYQRARKTVVWLGGDAGDAEIVANLMVETWKDMELKLGTTLTKDKKALREFLVDAPSTGVDFALSKHLKSFGSLAWDKTFSFFKHPWFTRIWVIQEVTVSPLSIFR